MEGVFGICKSNAILKLRVASNQNGDWMLKVTANREVLDMNTLGVKIRR